MHIHEWSADLNADSKRGKMPPLTHWAYQWQNAKEGPPRNTFTSASVWKSTKMQKNIMNNSWLRPSFLIGRAEFPEWWYKSSHQMSRYDTNTAPVVQLQQFSTQPAMACATDLSDALNWAQLNVLVTTVRVTLQLPIICRDANATQQTTQLLLLLC